MDLHTLTLFGAAFRGVALVFSTLTFSTLTFFIAAPQRAGFTTSFANDGSGDEDGTATDAFDVDGPPCKAEA